MAHYGRLGIQRMPDDIHDIRGTTVRGLDGEKLGNVKDVIFDHDTMTINYVVVDSDGWLEPGTLLLPAERICTDENHHDGLTTATTRNQIENSPQYDSESLHSGDDWKKYEQEFWKYWDEEPIMHIKGSDRIVTPREEPAQAKSIGQDSPEIGNREPDAAELFPSRIAPVFSGTAPSGGKVTLRPKSVARAEEAASGVSMLKPRWWEEFENYLRINKSDIQAECSQCRPTSGQERGAA